MKKGKSGTERKLSIVYRLKRWFLDLVIGFAFFVWVNSHIFVRLFERYMPKSGDIVPKEII